MLTTNDILTEAQLEELCHQAAKIPAFWDGLEPYPKQALRQYAAEKVAELNNYSLSKRTYYLALFSIYKAAEKLILLAETADAEIASGNDLNSINSTRRAKTAELKKLTLAEVKTIFHHFKHAISGPGDWAAALIALKEEGCLIGNPPEIERWFSASGFDGKTSRRSIQDRKGGDFRGDNERRIFTAVTQDVQRILSRK